MVMGLPFFLDFYLGKFVFFFEGSAVALCPDAQDSIARTRLRCCRAWWRPAPALGKRGFGAAGLNLAQGVPSGRYAVRPRLRARGFSADTGMTGWVFAKRAPPRTYGRWRTIPRTSGLTRLRGGRLGSRVRGFSRPRRHRRRHRRHRLPGWWTWI